MYEDDWDGRITSNATNVIRRLLKASNRTGCSIWGADDVAPHLILFFRIYKVTCHSRILPSAVSETPLYRQQAMANTPRPVEYYARQACVSLKGFDFWLYGVHKEFLQAKYTDMKQMSKAAQSRLAFMGDRIIHLAIAYHLNDMYEDYDDRLHLSLMKQAYITLLARPWRTLSTTSSSRNQQAATLTSQSIRKAIRWSN
jgi:hypothetical protein